MSQATNQGKLISFGVIAFFALVVLLTLSGSIFKTIDPGEAGVIFKRFGGGIDTTDVRGQGFHIIAPWNRMIRYDTRINESLEEMVVLSKNGLNITVELSYRYQPIEDKIGNLHETVGKEYDRRIIKPEIRSATREVIGKYDPEELYSSQREAIQDEIFTRTSKACMPKNIKIDAILIRDIELPEKVKTAISNKIEAEQEAQRYDYLLDQERKEAERKVIEAQAKADANKILNASLSDKILRDKGIEATLELSKSPNSKVVIVGGGDEGLPLILGN